MKQKLLVFIVIVFSFTSCVDLTEYFTINEDGSGVYEQKMDMTRAITGFSEMMESAGSGKNTSKKPKEKIDTVIYYASIVDTVTSLSAEQKNAFKKAYSKIHVDEANNEIVMHMFFPFSSAKEFNIIQTVIADNKAYGSISDIMLGALGSKNKQLSAMNAGEPNEDKNPSPTRDYMYTLTGTTLTRKVIEKTEADKSEEGIPEQLKELMKMNIKTVIKLPRTAKNTTGKVTLSDNKKEVSFLKEIDLGTKFTSADFDFTIEY
jgi:hypothetical protein